MRRDGQVASDGRTGREDRLDESEREVAVMLDGGSRRESRQGRVIENAARGSHHTEKGEWEGANKQQRQWESDKDGVDSRVECGER